MSVLKSLIRDANRTEGVRDAGYGLEGDELAGCEGLGEGVCAECFDCKDGDVGPVEGVEAEDDAGEETAAADAYDDGVRG